MKNHFLIPYNGNKRNEVQNIYESIKDKIENISTIVEPFCGSSALSYYISIKHPLKYEYVLNDSNYHLIELYKIAQDSNKLDELIIKLNEIKKDLTKEKYVNLPKDTLETYIIYNKIYNIRPGLYKENSKIDFNYLKQCPIIKFLREENIKFNCKDGLNVFEDYKDNSKAFIFLDPPYLESCNQFYMHRDVNLYEYFVNNNIDNMQSFIILCLENNWIIKLLFRHNKKEQEYSKKYECSKKTTTHIIIYNK